MPTQDFRIELGLNRKAATLSRTNPNMRLFPLQNGLIDVTLEDAPLPAWYTHFNSGDTLKYRLVDITDLDRSDGQEPGDLSIWVLFRKPHEGERADPFEEEVHHWRVSNTSELRWSPVFSRKRRKLPTWDIEWSDGDDWQTAPLTLAKIGDRDYRGFEMAVALEDRRDGWVNHYLFDPEMIVSERDTPDRP